MTNNFVVYQIKNILNDKIYVGSSSNYEKRVKSHLSCLKNNAHHCFYLQNAFNKYGLDNFAFSIIKTFNDKSEMLIYEESLLNDLSNKYNVSKKASGGDLISYHPNLEEIKKKHSYNYQKIKKINGGIHPFSLIDINGENNPNWRGGASKKIKCLNCDNLVSPYKKGYCKCCSQEGSRNSFYGKKHSKETIDKLKSIAHKKPINTKKVSVDGNIYDSSSDASKVVGCCMCTIHNRCKSKKFLNYFYIEG